MASVQDIPDELLSRTKAGEFVAWLRQIPIDHTTATALARIWERHVEHRLTTTQWQLIRAERNL